MSLQRCSSSSGGRSASSLREETRFPGSTPLPATRSYAIARNEVMKARRSHARRVALGRKLNGQARDPEPSPKPVVLRGAEIESLLQAMATLRPADQEILLLRSQEGLTAAEIAVALECSVEAAKKRSTRALHRLRKAAGVSEPAHTGSGAGANQQGGGGR